MKSTACIDSASNGSSVLAGVSAGIDVERVNELVDVLGGMEELGVASDVALLEEQGNKLSTQIDALEESIHHHAGGPLNINSPPQLREVLYEKLGFRHDADIMTRYGARYQRCDVAMRYFGLP